MQWYGPQIFAAYRHLFNCNDTLEAEIGAIVEGLALSIEKSDSPIMIQSDNASAIAALTKTYSIGLHLYTCDRDPASPSKLAGDQNRVADSLANIDHSGGSTTCLLFVPGFTRCF